MVWQSGGVGVLWCGESVAPHIKFLGGDMARAKPKACTGIGWMAIVDPEASCSVGGKP